MTKTIRVATYNIHKGIGGVDRRYRPERIAEALTAAAADVVLLQEVDDGCARSQQHRQVDWLGDALGLPHRAWAANAAMIASRTVSTSSPVGGIARSSRNSRRSPNCLPAASSTSVRPSLYQMTTSPMASACSAAAPSTPSAPSGLPWASIGVSSVAPSGPRRSRSGEPWPAA